LFSYLISTSSPNGAFLSYVELNINTLQEQSHPNLTSNLLLSDVVSTLSTHLSAAIASQNGLISISMLYEIIESSLSNISNILSVPTFQLEQH